MSHFKRALAHTLKWEGGYVDHPSDPGGATNHGVSLRWYRQAVDPSATAEDIRALTREDAARLYRDGFWKHQYDRFLSAEVATKVFDAAVNMGGTQAGRNFQRALQAAGRRDVVDDGVVGPATVAAANGLDEAVVLAAFRATLAGHYRLLVTRRPEFGAFLKGWLNRALD
jgi:lysozyme family protein